VSPCIPALPQQYAAVAPFWSSCDLFDDPLYLKIDINLFGGVFRPVSVGRFCSFRVGNIDLEIFSIFAYMGDAGDYSGFF
jgi:hypothetical protein